MHEFTDSAGNIYAVRITVGDCHRIQEQCGLDLLTPEKSAEKLNQMFTSSRQMIDLTWSLVEKRAEELGLDKLSWMDLLDVERLFEMVEVVKAAVRFFIRTLHPKVGEMLDRMEKTQTRILELEIRQVAEFAENPEVLAMAESEMRKKVEQAVSQLKRDFDGSSTKPQPLPV